jgi:hypothetical protein
MQKKDVPQDSSALENISRELYYAKNCEGKYETELSTGWDIKNDALNCTWAEVNKRVEDARNLVASGKKSPIWFYMEYRLMDISLLSKYTGFWKITIKRHFKPDIFKKLNDKKLRIYANVFDISVNNLKDFSS